MGRQKSVEDYEEEEREKHSIKAASAPHTLNG